MKYYSFETMFKSLKDSLKRFLLDSNIYFEISGAATNWHFEIFTDANGVEMINEFLDNNSILEG
jgi:hypothetical protein